MRKHVVYWLITRLYDYIATRDLDEKITFLNFGFAPLGSLPETGDCDAEDGDPNRRRKALYLKVASAIGAQDWNWAQKDVLEVGSGRGGGAAFLVDRLAPRAYCGVDLSSKAVQFCEAHYSLNGLCFRRGNAESLELPDASFDVLINIESSHCYPQMTTFLDEVGRVLRPGGYLLLADFRKKAGIGHLRSHLLNSGLERIKEEDITSSVLAALKMDSEANLALIEQHVPWWLRWVFGLFAGVEGSPFPNSFEARERQYWIFVYRKPVYHQL